MASPALEPDASCELPAVGGEIIGGGDEFDLPSVDAPQPRESFHSLSLPHVGGEMIFGKVATAVDVVAYTQQVVAR